MKTLQLKKNYTTISAVKSLEDIVATLVVIDKAYKERPTSSVQVTEKDGQPICELRDTPTRIIVAKKFKIAEDSANRRIQKLIEKGLVEVDPSRSYQGFKAFQRVYRLTGKGMQLLMLES